MAAVCCDPRQLSFAPSCPQVLFLPWWRRGRHRFRDLFYSYDAMPAEAREMLQQYYESRQVDCPRGQ